MFLPFSELITRNSRSEDSSTNCAANIFMMGVLLLRPILPGKTVPHNIRDLQSTEVDVALERLNGTGLVGLDVEDSAQLGHLKQVVHSFAEVEQLQLPATALDRCVRLDEFAKA